MLFTSFHEEQRLSLMVTYLGENENHRLSQVSINFGRSLTVEYLQSCIYPKNFPRLTVPGRAVNHAIIACATLPATSVKRKSRPA